MHRLCGERRCAQHTRGTTLSHRVGDTQRKSNRARHAIGYTQLDHPVHGQLAHHPEAPARRTSPRHPQGAALRTACAQACVMSARSLRQVCVGWNDDERITPLSTPEAQCTTRVPRGRSNDLTRAATEYGARQHPLPRLPLSLGVFNPSPGRPVARRYKSRCKLRRRRSENL